MQKQNSRKCPRGRPAPRNHCPALYFKQFFETQSYPWCGIGHLSIIRGAGSLGKHTSLQGKLCYSQGGLIIEEHGALQQERLNLLETLRCPRCNGIGHQEGHPVSRPQHSYVSGPLKVLNAAKLLMAAYFNPWRRPYRQEYLRICSRVSEITGIAPTGRHGSYGTWGDLLEHNKTITVLDLGYSQLAGLILDVEVKTPRISCFTSGYLSAWNRKAQILFTIGSGTPRQKV